MTALRFGARVVFTPRDAISPVIGRWSHQDGRGLAYAFAEGRLHPVPVGEIYPYIAGADPVATRHEVRS